MDKIEIEGMENFYGELVLFTDGEKYYWEVTCDITESEPVEISKELYDLILLENEK